MPSTLTLAFDSKIATITLTRAEKRNAICHALIEEFLAALDEVERSPAQVLILAAEGKAFCAGLDLEELRALAAQSAEENLVHSRRIARLLRGLYEFPRPTIAAVNGPAIAGGTALATLCDFTVASTEARFGYTEVRIGFVPAVVSAFLMRQVGEKHARELLLSGRIIDAAEAHRIGLVNQLVEPMHLAASARQLAEELLQNSPASMRATKELLRAQAGPALEREIELGMASNAAMRKTVDFAEGVASFLERRKPKWE